MYCHTFVSPGMGAALHTFFFFNMLITELLPTFGYPMNPMETCFRSFRSTPNCRRSCRRALFPKGFVIEAWMASVGNSFERRRTQARVTQVGTRSHLLQRST